MQQTNLLGEKVSVIVPVYNVEAYLPRCVESILGQTYRFLEIILVDDGSTDRSGPLCDRYEEADSRVKTVHKSNGGLSDARNVGIEIATGRYLTFVDSDDWIRDDYVEMLVKALQYGKTQISACAYRMTDKFEEEYENRRNLSLPRQTEVWLVLEAYRHLFLNRQINCSACAKLYERTIFEDIRFPLGKLYEDQFIAYKTFHKSQGVTYIDQEMYFYFNRAGSIQNESFTIRKMDELEANIECVAFIKDRYPQLCEAATCKLVSSCFHILFAIHDQKMWKREVGQLEKIIRDNRKKMLFGKDVNKKVRLGCLCSYLGFGFTEWVYRKSGIQGKINL